MTSYITPRASRQGRLTSMLTAQCGAPLIVAVPPVLVDLFGDWMAAAFVAQCAYLALRAVEVGA